MTLDNMKGRTIATLMLIASSLVGCTDKAKEGLEKGKAAQDQADFTAALAAYKEAQAAGPDSPSGKEAASKIAEVEKAQKQIDEMTEAVQQLARGLASASEMEEMTEVIEPGKPIKHKRCPPMKTPVPSGLGIVKDGQMYGPNDEERRLPTFTCAKWEVPRAMHYQVNVTGDDKSMKVTGTKQFGSKTIEVTLNGAYNADSLRFGKPEVARK